MVRLLPPSQRGGACLAAMLVSQYVNHMCTFLMQFERREAQTREPYTATFGPQIQIEGGGG